MYWRLSHPRVIPLTLNQSRRPTALSHDAASADPLASLHPSFQSPSTEHQTPPDSPASPTNPGLATAELNPPAAVIQVIPDPTRTLLLVLTHRDLCLWSLNPVALLAVETVTEALAHQVGEFCKAVWRPIQNNGRREFAVVTRHGYLRRYWVVDTDRTAYKYEFPVPHHYVPGPGEEDGIPLHTMRVVHSAPFAVPGDLVTLASTEQTLLLAFRAPGSLVHFDWDTPRADPQPMSPTIPHYQFRSSTTTQPYVIPDQVLAMADLPWCTTEYGYIRTMVHDPWLNVWCWVSDRDKICLVQDQSTPSSGPRHEWVGTGMVVPEAIGRPFSSEPVVAAVAANLMFGLLAVATRSGMVHLYTYNVQRHAIKYYRTLAVEPTPSTLNNTRTGITAAQWTDDGLVLTVTTWAGLIFQYSVYGSLLNSFCLAASSPWRSDTVPNSYQSNLPVACIPLSSTIFWDAGGTELFVTTLQSTLCTPDSTAQQTPTAPSLSTMYVYPFAKAAIAAQPISTNHRYLVLQASRHLITAYPQAFEVKQDSATGGLGLPTHFPSSPLPDPTSPTLNSFGFATATSPTLTMDNPLVTVPLDDTEPAPPSMAINPDLSWHVIAYPSMYLLGNWPIRYVTVDASGQYLAIAGRRGFALYSKPSHRWKLFRGHAVEQSFRCQGGIAWYHHWLIMPVIADLATTPDRSAHRAWADRSAHPMVNFQRLAHTVGEIPPGGKPELRIYSRHKNLDQHSVVSRYPVAAPILRVEAQPGCVLTLDVEGHIDEYAVEPSTSTKAKATTNGSNETTAGEGLTLVHHRRWTIHAIAPTPWHVRGFSRTFWFSPLAVPGHPNPALVVHSRGRLVLLEVLDDDPSQLAAQMEHGLHFSTPTESLPGAMTAPAASIGALAPQSRRTSVSRHLAHAITLARNVELFVPSSLFFTPKTAVAWVYSYGSVGSSQTSSLVPQQRINVDHYPYDLKAPDSLATRSALRGVLETDLADKSPTMPHGSMADLPALSIQPQLKLLLLIPGELTGPSPAAPTVNEVLVEVDFYPLGVVDEKGLVLGMEWATNAIISFSHSTTANGASSPSAGLVNANELVDDRTIFQLSKKTQLMVHHITRYLLRDQIHYHDAQNYLGYFEPYPYFPHILELLLHIVVEDEADRCTPGDPDALLPLVIQLVDTYDHHSTEVIAHCARKTEASFWPYLFTAVDGPEAFFNRCLVNGRLRTAAECLIILQTLLPMDTSTGCMLQLLQRAVQRQDTQLCQDLVQFFRAIASSDPELEAALMGIGIAAPDHSANA
ncbi:WD40 repeat protein [Dimargaris verticillata]|uniref:WD40 repeat protein n=1 Tax=Dimargaris verticillata TaxID=2761393 RepID=A0A9W8B968_9FUNG|nr:WD40 repeat protein [Dimargaris verticillata]